MRAQVRRPCILDGPWKARLDGRWRERGRGPNKQVGCSTMHPSGWTDVTARQLATIPLLDVLDSGLSAALVGLSKVMRSVLTRQLAQRAPAPAGCCIEPAVKYISWTTRAIRLYLVKHSRFACDVQVYQLGGLLHDVRVLTYHSRQQMHSRARLGSFRSCPACRPRGRANLPIMCDPPAA